MLLKEGGSGGGKGAVGAPSNGFLLATRSPLARPVPRFKRLSTVLMLNGDTEHSLRGGEAELPETLSRLGSAASKMHSEEQT